LFTKYELAAPSVNTNKIRRGVATASHNANESVFDSIDEARIAFQPRVSLSHINGRFPFTYLPTTTPGRGEVTGQKSALDSIN
jgi:hypothetical protein